MKHYRNIDWQTADVLEFKEEAAEAAENGDVDAVAAIERLSTALDAKMAGFATELKTVNTKFDGEIAKLKRIGTVADKPDAELEKKAFETFIRKGQQGLTADEFKTLRVSSDVDGGFLAPDSFIAELLRNVALFNPIRALARVSTVSTGAAILPRRTGGMTAVWVNETGTRSETSVTFGQNRYDVAELSAYVDVSNQLIEDAAFNIESELAFEFGEEFGVRESVAMITGDGVNKPFGFMSDTSVLTTNSGAASAITADELIDLYHAVPSAYRANAVFGMNSLTMGAIRKLKSGDGLYLVSTAGLAGAPATTLLGRPVIEMPSMPDIAGGAYPVIFGDFNQGYRIFDRISLSILRDPYTQATTGKTRFMGRRRVAGGVAKSEALRKLVISS